MCLTYQNARILNQNYTLMSKKSQNVYCFICGTYLTIPFLGLPTLLFIAGLGLANFRRMAAIAVNTTHSEVMTWGGGGGVRTYVLLCGSELFLTTT